MKNFFSTSLDYVKLTLLIVCILLFLATPVNADPIDEAYYKTFYITTLGGFNTAPDNLNNIFYYRDAMLKLNGGVMPKNLKVGYGGATWFLLHTQGSYYDYIYVAREVGDQLAPAVASDSHIGYFINGMPWGDSADQSIDILHNYLEKYNDGELLQKDCLGRIRDAALPQNPYTNEQAGTFSPFLEMQLTLSRNADVVQHYVGQNNHIAAGTINWQREQHPDLIVFTTMSSEYAQNTAANDEYCDYSDWSKQEFRDWLSGSGLYVGKGQYTTLTDFNNAFGFSYSSWDNVEPPTSVNWTSGSYWQKWNDFRIAQVNNMEQTQINWTQEIGWNPDRIYGHQIPFDPNTTSEHERKYASPWTTAFVENGSDGITTYGSRASDTTIFNAIRNDNKCWGIFEYNPLTTSVANNLSALNTVWNSGGHIVCPYLWYGQPTYQIVSNAFETALQQFISSHSSDSYSGLKFYEAAPGSKNIIWTMSESDDIENSADLSSIIFTNGIMSANTSGNSPMISLELDESSHFLISDAYYAGSFRMYIANAASGNGKIEWHDNSGNTAYVEFVPRQGWQVYKINMSADVNWRGKNIDQIKFFPGAENGSEVKIDWFRLEANHCWNFDSSDEINNSHNLSGEIFSNSVFSATDSSGDGYFYLSTDQNAKRAFIDSEFYKKIRFKMTSSANASCQFYWWTQTAGPFWNSIPVQPGSHSYELNLSDDTNWTGKIRVFRMDPVNANGVSFSIENLSIVPELLPPRMAAPDLVVNSPLPIFTWDKPVEPSAAGITYTMQVAADFDFTSIVYSADGLTECSNIYNGKFLADGLLWWRIRSEDSGGTVSSWSPPMAMFIRPWTFDREEDIASTHAMGTPIVTNGIWKAAVTNSDPYAYFNISSARGINADLYKKFYTRVRMTPSSGGNENFQFYFFPRAGNFYLITQSVPRDGQWHTIELDLSSDTNWYDEIAAFRIDPGHGAALTLEIDNAYFMPENAVNVSILNTNLANGIINVGYNQQLLSTGTVGATSWSLISGTLQNGLILNSNGTISGIPTEIATRVLTFEVDDQLARSATKQLSLEIIPEPDGVLWIFGFLVILIKGDAR